MEDHPRVRGEHGRLAGSRCRCWGSSPRARGALRPGRAGHPAPGIIPACAGSTGTGRPAGCPWGDHPRVRGEHACHRSPARPWSGSSPRARGAQHRPPVRRIGRGIIPACAGSTPAQAGTGPRPGDHPRVRGEHVNRPPAVQCVEGSSPRARGAHGAHRDKAGHGGIIPACAGSTETHDRHSAAGGDHPRVRGEHVNRPPAVQCVEGSSPRARGAHGAHRDKAGHGGIIPACAGSTARPAGYTCSHRDHPRVRGEHFVTPQGQTLKWGSSPRARGARPVGADPLASQGDHPRVRGEHSSKAARACLRVGSSPRARGAQVGGDRLERPLGIIPACAGSTTPRSPGYAPPGGSSPRARGALNVPAPFRSTRGIIPACAGSTCRVG